MFITLIHNRKDRFMNRALGHLRDGRHEAALKDAVCALVRCRDLELVRANYAFVQHIATKARSADFGILAALGSVASRLRGDVSREIDRIEAASRAVREDEETHEVFTRRFDALTKAEIRRGTA